jgi:hypothetical protein
MKIDELSYNDLCLIVDHLSIALMEVEHMITEEEDPDGRIRMRHEADQVEAIIEKLEGSLVDAQA